MVGRLLFALPQALVSLSPKYQAMLWGTAYLPVYLSRLGLTLLLAILFLAIYQRTRAVWDKWPALSVVVLRGLAAVIRSELAAQLAGRASRE